MFQWDVVDICPDVGGQNVLRTFEMAIRYNRRPTRTELERESFLSLNLFALSFKNSQIFSSPFTAKGGDRPRRPPLSYGSATGHAPKIPVILSISVFFTF